MTSRRILRKASQLQRVAMGAGFHARRFVLPIAWILGIVSLVSGAHAQTFTWNGATGNWADGANWVGGTAPLIGGAGTLQLTFGNASPSIDTPYTASQNFGTDYIVNKLILNNSSLTAQYLIDGSRLRLEGTTPTITMQGAGAFRINTDLVLRPAGLTIDGSGSGTLTLAGALIGQLALNKSSAGKLSIISNLDTSFIGTVNLTAGIIEMLGGSASTSSSTFRYNRFEMTAGTSLTYAGTSTATNVAESQLSGASIRTGELSGAGTINAVSPSATQAGLVISAFAPGASSATISTGSNGLYFRGLSTQTLSGNTSAVAGVWWIGGNYIGSGAYSSELTLSGAATISTTPTGLRIHGGSIVLDNTVDNINRIADSAGVSTTYGAGKISLLGNAAGTVELTGAFTASSAGGHIAMSVTVPGGASAPSVLQFGNTTQLDLKGNSVSSYNFIGLGGTLGGTGNTPRIVFSNGLYTGNGGLLSAGSGGTPTVSGVGFAVVNGTDWAGYSTATDSGQIRGVIALNSDVLTLTGATSASRVLLTASASSPTSSTTVASLKISPSADNQSLTLGANLVTSAVMLTGPRSYLITTSGSSFNLSNGTVVRYMWVTDPAGTLQIGGNVNFGGSTGSWNKVGDGWMELLSNGSNRINFTASRTVTLQQGVLRASLTTLGLTSETDGINSTISFRGGTLEIDGGGTLIRRIEPVDTAAAGAVNFDGYTGSGAGNAAFSAVNGDLTVTLKVLDPNMYTNQTNADPPASGIANPNYNTWGTTLQWGNGFWLAEGYSVVFGSARSTNTVTLTNDLILDAGGTAYNTFNVAATGAATYREFRVLGDGTMATRGILTGTINGSYTTDLLKTGPGILEIASVNYLQTLFSGNMLIAEGTMLLSNPQNPTGQAGYVMIGSRSGSANAALLANAAINTSGPRYYVPAGNSGVITIGGAPGFSGSGTFGNTLDLQKNVVFTAGGTSLPQSLITFSGAISGIGGITKQGVGIVLISGTNALTGNSALENGTLRLGSQAALGTVGSLTVSGGTLELAASGGGIYANPVIVSGNAAIVSDRNSSNGSAYTHTIPSLSIGGQTLSVQAGSLVTSGTATILVSGNSSLLGNASFDVGLNARLTFSGAVFDGSVSRTYTKSGVGTLLLGAAGDASMTGANSFWQVNAGILQVGVAQGLGASGKVTLNAGRLDFANNSSTTFNANVTVAGTSTITASRATTSSTSVTHTLGTLSVGAQTINFGPGDLVTTGNLSFTNTTITGDAIFNVLANSTVRFNTSGNVGGIVDDGNTHVLTKTGPGRLVLAGDNSATITGLGTQWVILDGVLQTQGVLRLGNNTVDLVFNGGTWNVTGSTTPEAGYEFRFNGAGTIDIDDTFTVSLTRSTSQLLGAGSLTKAGLGTLSVTTAQTFTGAVFVNGGTFQFSNATALGSPLSNSAITLSGGTLKVVTTSLTLPTTRPIVVAASSGSAIDVATGLTLTVPGGLSGTGPVSKTGDGKLVLSSAAAGSYTGAASVQAGTLAVNQPLNLTGGGSIVVAVGATLGGTGAITGTSSESVVVNGILSPGNSVGTLTVSGPSNSWASGSSVYFEFKDPTGTDAVAGTNWDLLDLTGSTLALGSTINLRIDAWKSDNSGHATLTSQNAFNPNSTYQWLFVRTGGISGFTPSTFVIADSTADFGVFGTPNNAFTPAGGSFWVSQSGNDLYINYSAVPEPGSLVFVGMAALGCYVVRRRKRRQQEAQLATVPVLSVA
ncbi:MAG: hypothetical protein C0483_17955 [Pirellula sp.]|nr:hypothetical protein [Pirellula sp.]